MAKKQPELVEFLQSHQIDVAVITETHLKPANNFRLPHHSLVRLDRTGTQIGGGVAVAIKRGLEYRTLPDLRLSTIEAVGVELSSPDGPLKIIAAYCPTQCRKTDGSSLRLKNDLQKLTRWKSKFIVAGDFNARHALWGNMRANRNGAILAEDLQAGQYVTLHADSPTFYSPAGVGSSLDIALTNVADVCSTPSALTELSSDHLPVVFDMDHTTINQQQFQRRNYHRAKWPQLQRFIEDRIPEDPPMTTTGEIDDVLSRLTDDIADAERRYIPSSPVTRKFTNIDLETKRIISLRNAVRRQFQRTRHPGRKALYKRLNAIIATRIDKIRNRQFQKDLKNMPSHSKPLWRVAKVLKTKPKPIPPLKVESRIQLSAQEKANSLANQFVKSHNLGRDIASPMEASVYESVFQLANSPIEIPVDQRITREELVNAIKCSRNMKAPGFDGLFNIVLKNLGPNAILLLVKIFNRCLEIGYFPAAWKLSKVVPIAKPGKDPTDPSSYRPISLLSSLSKLFERVIHSRLLHYTETNNLLLDEQFGFRRGHSTVHQLQRVTNSIRQAKAVSKSTVMAFLDIEKAFDNVWQDGLVHKLLRFNFPVYLVKIISDYLDGRTSRVSIGNALSDPYPVTAGVPQGSILGPLLYSLFTSDIPPLPGGGTLSLFADDSAISYIGRVMRTLVSKLQSGLDAYVSYLSDWKICVNGAKTQAIVFPHRNTERLKPTTNIKVQNSEIEWSKMVRYIGLTLDQKLLFGAHIDDRVVKGTVLLKRLYPLINRRSKLSVTNKLAVYKAIVAPMLEYGSPVWQGCAKTHRRKLQVLQNKYLKMILNLPHRTRTTEVHRLANHAIIDQRLSTINERHRQKAIVSEFESIRNIYPPPM